MDPHRIRLPIAHGDWRLLPIRSRRWDALLAARFGLQAPAQEASPEGKASRLSDPGPRRGLSQAESSRLERAQRPTRPTPGIEPIQQLPDTTASKPRPPWSTDVRRVQPKA